MIPDAPERHPECSWEPGNGPSDFVFICTWQGGYPAPTLEWHEVYKPSVIAKGPTINSTSQETERLEVHVNRFILEDKEEVKCIGNHVSGLRNSCSFALSKTIIHLVHLCCQWFLCKILHLFKSYIYAFSRCIYPVF